MGYPYVVSAERVRTGEHCPENANEPCRKAEQRITPRLTTDAKTPGPLTSHMSQQHQLNSYDRTADQGFGDDDAGSWGYHREEFIPSPDYPTQSIFERLTLLFSELD